MRNNLEFENFPLGLVFLEISTKNHFRWLQLATDVEVQGFGDCFGHLNDHFPPKIPFPPQNAWTDPLWPRLMNFRETSVDKCQSLSLVKNCSQDDDDDDEGTVMRALVVYEKKKR